MVNVERAQIGAVFLGWAIFSSIADTLNKTVLLSFPYPITLTIIQFGVSVLCARFLFAIADLYYGFTAPKVGSATIRKFIYKNGSNYISWGEIWPLTVMQTLGFALTNLSFGKVAVSFTQTVKVNL